MMRAILLTGLGGAIGSILRYLITIYSAKFLPGNFPWGTLIPNLLGCFLIGILLSIFDRQQSAAPDFKLLLITGFCGGFTTFSAFASENVRMFQQGNALMAFAYIGTSVILSLLAVWAGMMVFDARNS